MDPKELLYFQLQRGQATAHSSRKEVSGFGDVTISAPNVDSLTGKKVGGVPMWALALGGVAAAYFVYRATRSRKA